ncbi:MAG: hypothetical protein K9G76_11925 [Bacteroidales bacterium]|nr:hypothetical protein [Bacteroidales bacterium]MCF8405151.1 hypothetical protein [Bacteroidales bacterium]
MMKNKLKLSGIFLLVSIFIIPACTNKMEFTSSDDMVAFYRQNIEEISPAELKAKLEEGEMFLLIDVREPGEHNLGYIPGAVNIPRGTLEFKIGKEEYWESQFMYLPEKTDEIIIYCKKGNRGVLAVNALKQLGYTNVKNLQGGWKEWEMTYPLDYEKNLEEMGHGAVEEVGGC